MRQGQQRTFDRVGRRLARQHRPQAIDVLLNRHARRADIGAALYVRRREVLMHKGIQIKAWPAALRPVSGKDGGWLILWIAINKRLAVVKQPAALHGNEKLLIAVGRRVDVGRRHARGGRLPGLWAAVN
jgi:hypothetical protein